MYRMIDRFSTISDRFFRCLSIHLLRVTCRLVRYIDVQHCHYNIGTTFQQIIGIFISPETGSQETNNKK